MYKIFIYWVLLLPVTCFSQVSITGRILNQADDKPVANANVFLSNATIGDHTLANGTFALRDVLPGKYDLVVSVVGFETQSQTVTVGNGNITIPVIKIRPKTTALKEVTIKYHTDPNREKYYEMFQGEFLGTSDLAKQCKILNPELLDLSYTETTKTLTATSIDFLEIANDALGYRIKYLVTDFSLQNFGTNDQKVYYKGRVLFEEMKGTQAEERRWEKQRQEVYENSPMHFLRSALNNRINEGGFSVQQLSVYANPARPSDSLINVRINFYKNLKSLNSQQRDSLALWIKKSKLPKTIQKLQPFQLNENDIIKPTDQPNQYALGCENDGLYIAYNKSGHFHINDHVDYLYNSNNTENTLIKFNSPFAFFYRNGVIINPYGVMYYGVWGRDRVAELLPINYTPPNATDIPDAKLAENINAKLDTFLIHHVNEKAYLHFDKPYYAAGDTIYFKAYVTLGEKHQPSGLSGVLHVDLINTNNKVDQSIKLQIANGVAWGDFTLPDSLPGGNYRVRAYTNWMRNEGDAAFFVQTIPVASALTKKIPESGTPGSKVPNNKADVHFFPEGGNLITGVSSKIAFKAIGTNGLGINLKGQLLDNNNHVVTTFTSTHLGMGYFYLTPEEGKTYKAKMTYTDGTQDVIDLPKAGEKGIILSINNDSIPKASVRIAASKTYFLENKNKVYSLLIWSGGVVTTVPCTLDSNIITLDILKRRLHTGIATVTLFSPAGEPLCERLFFVQNYDQLNLSINTDKMSYAKREKVTIRLKALNRADSAASGHFSVSVIDESKVPVDENDENTILANILLTSDLKGYVEQPNYYFTNLNDKTNADLDLVMLTHGYRRFEWKKILNDEYPAVNYQPENGLTISGIAKNGAGKPLINGTVSLITPKGGPVTSRQTDEKGIFSFNNLAFTDSAKFILQAVNSNGNNTTTLVYTNDKPLPIAPTAPGLQDTASNQPKSIYLENSLKQHDEAVKYGKANGIMLKEVKIRQTKKHIIDTDYPSSSLLGPGHADQVMHRAEIEHIGGQLSTSLNGRLHGIVFSTPRIGSGGVPYLKEARGPMLIVVDGVHLVPGSGVDQLNPNQIETIEVLRFASASIYGLDGGNGVLVVTTRHGGQDPEDIKAVGILPVNVKGFYKAREFYSPKYIHQDSVFNRADLRSTIYWNPELRTEKNGVASFNYYNADGTGSYRVVIEGIDENGNLGRQVYRYKVSPLLKLKSASEYDRENTVPEKSYLQFDKPYYALGDTIWFKAWLMNASTNLLSAKSGLLHIDIATDSNKVIKQYLLPVQAGVSWGNIALDGKDYKSGTYIIRAYTNWMRNFGDDYFFYKRFYVSSNNENNLLVNTRFSTSTLNKVNTVNGKLLFSNMDKKPFAVESLQVQVMNGNRHLYKQKLNTGVDGILDLNFNIPPNTSGLAIIAENEQKDKRAVIPITLNQPENTDLQLLPEGGNIVANINTRIGFKAISEDGKGTNVSGIITDQNQNQVTSFQSLYNGMGSFEFVPQSGKQYSAKLKLPDGSTKTYPLPPINPSGTVLQVFNKVKSDSVTISFSATDDIVKLHNSYVLTGKVRGVVCYTATISFSNGNKITKTIAKSQFRSGITHFIITTTKGQPLNERLVFIDRHDGLHINIEPDQDIYQPKDNVALKLRVTDNAGNPVTGDFSLAVTDDAQVKTDSLNTGNIITHLLLTSDLKGYVEQPGYYLRPQNAEASDNLLLTQGWINYEPKQGKPPYDAETEFMVKGGVKNIFSKPVKRTKVLLFSKSPFLLMDTLTDENGKFNFNNFPKVDTPIFIIKAVNGNGNSFNVTVNMDEIPPPPFTKPAYPLLAPWYVNSDTTLLSFTKSNARAKQTQFFPRDGHILKEVKITAKKIIQGSQNLNGPGNADVVLDEKDLEKAGKKTFRQLFEQNIKGFREIQEIYHGSIRTWYYIYRKPIFLIVNGERIDQLYNLFNFKQYIEFNNAEDVKGMEIISSPKYGANYGNKFFPMAPADSFAFVEITTRSGNPMIENTPGMYLYKPLTINWPKVFYKPKYPVKDTVKHTEDLRSTIDWEPNIITDDNGKATIYFYAAGRQSTYTVIMEGCDFNGNLGYKLQKISVRKPKSNTK